ncbi:protease complex subunit PrcB family protein [Ectothiorhodospiraceae bacterium 2226]|nr:protease complex subunit PrcB family protein [Ectothiorhodospiraceae bacterium 2226]
MRRWFALALALLLAACAAQALPMHEIAVGQHSQFHEPAHIVVRDAQSWRDLWEERLHGAPPAIDFEREMVVGAALGTRPSGGYGIRIERAVLDEEGTLVVTLRELAPPPGAMLSQAFTQPFHFVRVPRVDARVAFRVASDP